MPLNFPSSPALNDVYTYGDSSWKWNGTVWAIFQTSIGSTGPQGTTGNTGPTGTNGQGLTPGGLSGQYLAKKSNSDYETEWRSPNFVSLYPSSIYGNTIIPTDASYTPLVLQLGTAGTYSSTDLLIIKQDGLTYARVTENSADLSSEGGNAFSLRSTDFRLYGNSPARFYASSGTNHIKLQSASSLSTTYTLTLPSVTSTLAALDLAQTFSTGQTIVSSSISNVPLTVKGFASQSGDHLQVLNSSNTILAKIDANGYIGIGNTTTTNTAVLDMIHGSGTLYAIAARVTQGGSHPGIIRFEKSRNNGTIFTNDRMGEFQFVGHDGTAYRSVGGFGTICSGTPSSNNVPTRLWIGVTPGYNSTSMYGDGVAQILIDGPSSCITLGQSLGAGVIGLTAQTDAAVAVLNNTASKKGFVVKGHTAQTANIFEAQEGGTGNVFFGIDSRGGLLMRTANNQSVGSLRLNAGSAFVANTFVSSTSYIFLSASTTAATAGHLSYTSHAGVSFTVNSTSPTDDRFVNWFIVKGV